MTPLRLGLLAAASELDRIAALADELQKRLSPLMRHAATGPFESAQSLDAIQQQAAGAGEHLRALGEACEGAWCVDLNSAATGLRLEAQRRRLTLEPTPGAAEAAGELELL